MESRDRHCWARTGTLILVEYVRDRPKNLRQNLITPTKLSQTIIIYVTGGFDL